MPLWVWNRAVSHLFHCDTTIHYTCSIVTPTSTSPTLGPILLTPSVYTSPPPGKSIELCFVDVSEAWLNHFQPPFPQWALTETKAKIQLAIFVTFSWCPQEGLDHVDFGSKESTTNLWICSGVGGLVRHNGSDRWLVGKPFNKTGDSLPACLPQLQYDWSSIFVWINLYFAASSCCCWTIFLIVFIELLPTAVGCRRVIHVSDLPPKLGWPGLAPQIALSRPDICQIHSRRIICLKLSIQHW